MVRKLFPDWGVEISRLALSNETFRDMCEEYGLAVGALELLERRNLPQDVERMHEYRALIKQLERDLKYELLAAYDRARETWERDPGPHTLAVLETGLQFLIQELHRPGKFELGQMVMTPGADETLRTAQQMPLEFLLRHKNGDWLRCVTR